MLGGVRCVGARAAEHILQHDDRIDSHRQHIVRHDGRIDPPGGAAAASAVRHRVGSVFRIPAGPPQRERIASTNRAGSDLPDRRCS